MAEVVVGVDGSPGGRRALAWSQDYAACHHSRVSAVHVWKLPVSVEVPLDISTRRWLQAERGPNDATDPPDEPTTRAVAMPGHPGPALVQRARHAALLVVGTQRHAGLANRLGRIASYCLHHSLVPVAVVPALPDSSQMSSTPQVIVGVDLTNASGVALRWAARHARNVDAELVVVHAWQLTPAAMTTGGGFGTTTHAPHQRALQQLSRWVGRTFPEGPPSRLQLSADHGGPLDNLLEHATPADLIVLGSHGHGALLRHLLGSMSTELSVLAPCPVIVVPAGPQRTGAGDPSTAGPPCR